MKLYKLFISLIGLLCLPPSNELFATVESTFAFSQLPQDGQLYPRNTSTNEAIVEIVGNVQNNQDWEKLLVHVYIEQDFQAELRKELRLKGSKADSVSSKDEAFYFSYTITAGLHNYHFFILAEDETGNRRLIKKMTNIVAGDAYIIQGQSNAEARRYEGDANENQSEYIRVFGCGFECDETWNFANGNRAMYQEGNIGQWGLKMAKLLVDYHQIPIAIFNGAHGDKRIAFFQRNDEMPTDSLSNYGRLLNRVAAAHLTNHIRGIFWSQGENNGYYSGEDHLIDAYKEAWIELQQDWREDFPNLEKIYILQTRQGGCGSPLHYIVEAQRQLANELDGVEIMSSNNVAHDGCHFPYEEGYEWIGERMYYLVANELYQAAYQNVTAPNIDYCYWVNDTAIALVMQNTSDVLFWEEGAEKDFRIEGTEVPFVSGYTSNNRLILQLESKPEQAIGLSYTGHSGGAGPWITNATGVGIINFFKLPIQENRIALHLKVFLEGTYNVTTNLMETVLYEEDILPQQQPFIAAPWNYQGSESVVRYQESHLPIVDWLLIELRDVKDTKKIIAQGAALLLEDGRVIDAIDLKAGVFFPNTNNNESYYVAIRSRNHLDVLSEKPAYISNGLLSYDFTNIANVKSKQVQKLRKGVAGLYVGDLNADGVITIADLQHYQQESTIIRQYVASDCNFDAMVSVNDFNQLRLNMGLIAIPDLWYELR